MRVRPGAIVIGAAAALLGASAIGLLGAWAMGVGLVLVVGTSVVTAIVWEERDAASAAPSSRAGTPDLPDELIGAPAAGR